MHNYQICQKISVFELHSAVSWFWWYLD